MPWSSVGSDRRAMRVVARRTGGVPVAISGYVSRACRGGAARAGAAGMGTRWMFARGGHAGGVGQCARHPTAGACDRCVICTGGSIVRLLVASQDAVTYGAHLGLAAGTAV